MTGAPVALIGLGAMGFGMGESLLRAGLDVCGIDRDPDRMAAFAEKGGRIAADEAAIRAELSRARVAILVVVNAAQTEEVLFGPGGIAGQLPEGAVVVSCATFAPEHAIEQRR